jgi:hypothetical protein
MTCVQVLPCNFLGSSETNHEYSNQNIRYFNQYSKGAHFDCKSDTLQLACTLEIFCYVLGSIPLPYDTMFCQKILVLNIII